MTWIGRNSTILFWIGIFVFLMLQLMMTDADPDMRISASRGPFTDEGLNTIQVRNFVNHGRWGMEECDNLVKSPLYNAWLLPFLEFFGSSRIVARLVVLLSSLVLFLFFSQKLKKPLWALFILAICGLEYHLFQFFHFAMTEVIAIHWILAGVYFCARYIDEHRYFRSLFLALLCFFVACLFKYQFIYSFGIAGLTFLHIFFRSRLPLRSKIGMAVSFSLSCISFFLIYYFTWYSPNSEIFDRVWANQGAGRYPAWPEIPSVLYGNFQTVFLKRESLVFQSVFLITFILGLGNYKKFKGEQRTILLVSGFWLLTEANKLFIPWLPSRYALGLFFAQGLWMSVVLYTFMKIGGARRFAAIALSGAVIGGNVFWTSYLFRNRTFNSQEIIKHYAAADFEGRKVIGAWATSLVWNPTAYIIPAWKGFLNDTNIIEVFEPVMIVTEAGEKDSEKLFESRNIDLHAVDPDPGHFSYGPYEILFYERKNITRMPAFK